jgi:hypothetical protein
VAFFHGQQSFSAFGRRRLALGLLLGSDAAYYLQWKVGGLGTICIYQVWSLIVSLFHAFRHFYLLCPLCLTFCFWIFLFMHWRRSTSFQLPTTIPISSSVFIVLAASLCIGLILLTLDNDPYPLIAGQFISMCDWDLTTLRTPT